MRIALFLVFAGALAAQVPDSQVVFEVATVRHGALGDYHVSVVGGPGTSDPTRVSIENDPLSSLVEMAYGLNRYQLSSPGWLEEERFWVTAKLPEKTSKEQFHLMMRNLLIERFHLAAHFEHRQAAGYRLVVAKGGPELAPSPGDPRQTGDQPKPDPAKPPGAFKLTTDREGYPELPPGRTPAMAISYDRARWRFVDQSMERFAGMLGNQIHQPVVDGTGLEGKYDFMLTWSYAAMRPDPPPDAGPSISAAIQEQLGLKLVSEKVPVDTLVIDHIEKTPSGN